MEILERLVVSSYNIGKNNTPYKTTGQWLTQAHDQIIELWKKCLLEKGEPLYTDDMDAYQQGFALGVAQGHNQAITQAQKNMEG